MRDEANAAIPARGKPGVPFWMWAAVAALLLLTAYSTWDERRLQRQIYDLEVRADAGLKTREALVRERDELQREAVILSDPASVNIAMSSPDRKMPALEAKWHAKLGIVVTGQKVPSPPGEGYGNCG